MRPASKVLFIDRDGTLIEEPDDEQVDRLDKLRLMADVVPALRRAREAGFRLVIVSNQDGLGTDAFPAEDFEGPHAFMLALFESQGIVFDEVFICPHLPAERCACRKPRTGLLTRFLAAEHIDLARSAVVGDRDADLELARNLGVAGFRIGDELGWLDIVHRLVDAPRRASVVRKTSETAIRVELDLDAAGPQTIRTGIGFFDHMLEQIARHGRFALSLDCDGDLDIDDHHSIEDTALALGEAIRNALGDKRGIGRYGAWVPMDESLAEVVVDISGRPACRFDAAIDREFVGGMATEMVPHFFQSLSQALGAAVHVKATGDNAHHIVEACFKGLGRALADALARGDTRAVPSTKGML